MTKKSHRRSAYLRKIDTFESIKHIQMPRFELTPSPLLQKTLIRMHAIVPDWEAVARTIKKTDSRIHIGNKGNAAGSVAEHLSRITLVNALVAHARKSGARVLTHLIPNTVIRAGNFIFHTDVHTHNCRVVNAQSGQVHTEFDGLLAIQHPGQHEPEIVVVESKKSTPRLPRHKGIEYVNAYIERKLIPLRALFHTDKFSFVLSTCASAQLTRNQKRFITAFQKLGGQIATLGIQKHELEAFVMSL